MSRTIRKHSFVFTASANSSEVDFAGGVFAMLQFPASFGSDTVTPQIKCDYTNDEWANVYDSNGDDIVITATDGKATRIPDACFPNAVMRLVATGSITGTVRCVSGS